MAPPRGVKEVKSIDVMQEEGVAIAWPQLKIRVDGAGRASVDISCNSRIAGAVWHTQESVRVVAVDDSLPSDKEARQFAWQSFLNRLAGVNAKYFILTQYASELIAALNEPCSTYTDDLVKKDDLMFADLSKVSEHKGLPDTYVVEALNLNRPYCDKVAKFQQDNLPWLRPNLSPSEVAAKIESRYKVEPIIEKAASQRIAIYVAVKAGEVVATLTCNLHVAAEKLASKQFAYLSDLFVAKGLDNDKEFIIQFIQSVFTAIPKRFSDVRIVSVMSAPGSTVTPLEKCFAYAKQEGLLHPLAKKEQKNLGIVARFVYKPEDNKGKTHLSGKVSDFSVFRSSVSLPGAALAESKAEFTHSS